MSVRRDLSAENKASSFAASRSFFALDTLAGAFFAVVEIPVVRREEPVGRRYPDEVHRVPRHRERYSRWQSVGETNRATVDCL